VNTHKLRVENSWGRLTYYIEVAGRRTNITDIKAVYIVPKGGNASTRYATTAYDRVSSYLDHGNPYTTSSVDYGIRQKVLGDRYEVVASLYDVINARIQIKVDMNDIVLQ